MMPGEAGPLSDTERVATYSTVLPTSSPGWRRSLASSVSTLLHLLLIVFLVQMTRRQQAAEATRSTAQEETRPIQLDFAPPRPKPTPRPPTPEPETPKPLPPAVPLTPGHDPDPGTTARVNPTPEEEPNAPPETKPETATRPDPGTASTEQTDRADNSTPPRNLAAPVPAASTQPSMETEARRLFGRPSSKLGPVSGVRDNRPWESPIDMASNGCTLPPPEVPDSTLPPGMTSLSGKIYDERTGQPLGGARLQILGTPYGAFANSKGEYTLVFERGLVDRCRTQSVRVSAPGYPGRDVILSIGQYANGDVPLRRY